MHIRRTHIRALALTSLLAGSLLFACNGGSSDDGDPGGSGGIGAGGGGGGADGGPGGSGAGGSGTGGGGSPSSCESTLDCRGDAVCDPASGSCTEERIACESHADCSDAAYCTDAGDCARSTTGGPCGADEDCPRGEQCTGGFCGCKGSEFAAEAVPPNVLIMLDKSGSMDDRIDGTTKWDIAAAAIESLLAEYGEEIRFGLSLYPEGRSCSAGSVLVDVGDGTAAEILAELDAHRPNGSTPIGGSLQAALGYPGLEDELRENYVLLLTDGEETCGGDGEAAVEALREKEQEVKTFVVGFGGGVDAGELGAMAVAGGTALSGDPAYYQADDAASLAAAFADIGGEVLSCSYQLGETVGVTLTADDIFVYFDGEPVEHDGSQSLGWDYDEETNQVTFYGAHCDSLRSGSVEDLVIVHGCPIDLG